MVLAARIQAHHGMLSPEQRHSFYWSLAVSFVGLIICLSILASESSSRQSQFDQGTGRYIASCTEFAFCIPTLIFLVLFCLLGMIYGGFFVVSHIGMSTSSEAFERHLQAVQFKPDENVLAHAMRKRDEQIGKKYRSLLSRAQSLLDKGKLKDAETVYDGIMHDYVYLTYDQKQLLHQEINEFYKRLHGAIKAHHKKQHVMSAKGKEHLSKNHETTEANIGQDDGKQAQDRNERLLLKGKSKEFLKCWSLINRSNKALLGNDIEAAREQYKKSRKIYLDLNYHEKKDAYADLHRLYRSLSENALRKF